MKNFFAATAAASLLIFGGQAAEASTVEIFDTVNVTQESNLLISDDENFQYESARDRIERKRREWERRHRHRYDYDYYGRRRYYPHPLPPPPPPPPPPPMRPGHGPLPPPPPPPPRRW